MGLEVAPEDAARIEAVIGSDASPVGIDAKKTHVIILQKLEQIEQRLSILEEKLSASHE